MTLSDIQTVYLRPNPRLPKLIALAMIYWQMWKDGIDLPAIEMLPENEQPTGPGIYNLDCFGNAYRNFRLYCGEIADNEAEVVIDTFYPQIDVTPALDCIADLVGAHNTRTMRADNQSGKGTQRSDRNILNRYPGSLGFLTGSAWEVVHTISASKWKEIVYGQTEEQAVPGKLTEQDFLRLALHMIFIYVAADNARREKTLTKRWEDGLKEPVIRNLLDTEFQGKRIIDGLGHPLTIGTFIKDLYEVGSETAAITALVTPLMSIWLRLEQCIEDAPQLTPTHKFRVGNSRVDNAVVFDFVSKDGKPVKGTGNPLVHQSWLSDNENGVPRANCVIIRRETGHVAIFCRNVETRSIEDIALILMGEENGRWTHESGLVIFNGSKSRPDQKVTEIPLIAGKSLMAICQQKLVLYQRRGFPNAKFAKRDELVNAK